MAALFLCTAQMSGPSALARVIFPSSALPLFSHQREPSILLTWGWQVLVSERSTGRTHSWAPGCGGEVGATPDRRASGRTAGCPCHPDLGNLSSWLGSRGVTPAAGSHPTDWVMMRPSRGVWTRAPQ